MISDPYAWSTSLASTPPQLTSEPCARSLSNLFHNAADLSVATEASSHPAGLIALYSQPYLYAGGGLGNVDECPLQSCIAGAGVRRDSINFASVCVPPKCSAYDLAAADFDATIARTATASVLPDVAQEYVTLLQRINEINGFLGTGWTCGVFQVPWVLWPWGWAYILFLGFFFGLGCIALLRKRCPFFKRVGTKDHEEDSPHINNDLDDEHDDVLSPKGVSEMVGLLIESGYSDNEETKHNNYATIDSTRTSEKSHLETGQDPTYEESNPWWSCFDVPRHLASLLQTHAPETACLDGLRVGSLFWIMLGHVMAINSTSGAGFSNPAAFLPPHGLTTTIPGQLLFSSRFAVDTFLCISGFLVVHVLNSKLPAPDNALRTRRAIFMRYSKSLPMLLISRVARVLPIYALTLGLYTQIAPHLGEGPFWYQWLALLKPCHDNAWTNFLFINNFVPFDTPTTDTCFYHSWYLAVDMQLFLFAPLLVFTYQVNSARGILWTRILFLLSVAITAYLTFIRHWSINTFDGAAVARFDVEAYTKPHTRAQSYLAGMHVAMTLPSSTLRQRSPWNWIHRVVMTVVLFGLVLVTFIPSTGGYARRPCQYKEEPQLNQCGSSWSMFSTFLYTGFSRTVWTVCIAMLMHLCMGRRHVVASILSWKCWIPLSHLSFGAYLIHPIVIFVWQLGETSKQVFCLETFGMKCLSIQTVSFVLALAATLLVELPCADLWKMYTLPSLRRKTLSNTHLQQLDTN